MMGYKLRVISDDLMFEFEFFDNFMKSSGYWEDTNGKGIDHFLKPYNAKNCVNEPFIEFETEQDAMWFVLRWT